jgi:hypothetical protein
LRALWYLGSGQTSTRSIFSTFISVATIANEYFNRMAII